MPAVKQLIKKIPGSSYLYYTLKSLYADFKLKSKSTEWIFTNIFERNKWEGRESISGAGSDLDQTEIIIAALPILFRDFSILSLLDIPCGDFHWMNKVNLKDIKYIGADIVDKLTNNNKDNYEKEGVHFQYLNLITDKLPTVDLILCRDCFVHFSFKDIFKSLINMCRTQSKYLLTTTFLERTHNPDILTGKWRPLNLEIPPFNFPKPIKIICEECTLCKGAYTDKSLGLWRLEDICNILYVARSAIF